jgi:sarcosine oxidase subunit gamma
MMEGTVRRSPVHGAVERLDPEWGRIGSAPVALHFGDPEGEAALEERLGLCDVSALKRFGVKGPNAHRWLLDRGVEVPEPANSWLPLSDGRGLVARLGRSEFLVEDGPGGSIAEEVGDSLNSGTRGIYPVVRQDAAFTLTGERAGEVMLQVCGVDFGALDYEARPVVLTRVAVISAVVLPRVEGETRTFRIWCSSAYGIYLWEELRKIVEEIGGGVVGLSAVYGEGGR